MDGISRARTESTFDNRAVDVDDSPLDASVRANDDPTAGPASGAEATARVYDAINALDHRTPALGSHTELAVYGTVNPTAIAPAPISAAQGRQLAAAARQMLAHQPPASSGKSPWSLAGTATCRSPEISSARYAGAGVWKCNVFVGEAFSRAGLSFPLSSVGHYATANSLANRTDSFQRVTNLNEVRPGDLVSINRRGDSGHVEIVTGVSRDAAGHVRTITSLAAHEDGLREEPATAAALVQVASEAGGHIPANGVIIKGDTFHVLRPKAVPVPARDLIRTNGPVRG